MKETIFNFELLKNKKGKYGVILKAKNNRIVLSSKAYSSKKKAKRMLVRLINAINDRSIGVKSGIYF
jgi:uncharacterized protein YegP (UPF0339 family)